jgi:hypothetical protein
MEKRTRKKCRRYVLKKTHRRKTHGRKTHGRKTHGRKTHGRKTHGRKTHRTLRNPIKKNSFRLRKKRRTYKLKGGGAEFPWPWPKGFSSDDNDYHNDDFYDEYENTYNYNIISSIIHNWVKTQYNDEESKKLPDKFMLEWYNEIIKYHKTENTAYVAYLDQAMYIQAKEIWKNELSKHQLIWADHKEKSWEKERYRRYELWNTQPEILSNIRLKVLTYLKQVCDRAAAPGKYHPIMCKKLPDENTQIASYINEFSFHEDNKDEDNMDKIDKEHLILPSKPKPKLIEKKIINKMEKIGYIINTSNPLEVEKMAKEIGDEIIEIYKKKYDNEEPAGFLQKDVEEPAGFPTGEEEYGFPPEHGEEFTGFDVS